jgi:hypothetical protein
MMNLVKDEWVQNQNQLLSVGSNIEYLLQDQTIIRTMYQSDYSLFSKEIEYLKTNHQMRLEALFDAPVLSSATLYDYKGIKLCPNDTHHLYHLCRYFSSIEKLNEQLDIVEWGGGYGNMAKVFSYCFSEYIGSYTIFDLPKMGEIQKNYLNRMSIEGVDLIDSTKLDCIEKAEDCSLFISTWALSECTTDTIDMVSNSNLLDKGVLVALHQCGNHIPFFKESSYLREILLKKGCIENDVVVIPGINSYLMK